MNKFDAVLDSYNAALDVKRDKQLKIAEETNELEGYIDNLPLVTPVANKDGIIVGAIFKIGGYPTEFQAVVLMADGKPAENEFTSKHQTKLIDGRCIAYDDARDWAKHVAINDNVHVWNEAPASVK